MADLTIPHRSRFLRGPFAPVTEEIPAVDLPVTGRLPPELSGRYLRNGPNPLGLDEPVQHWFLRPGSTPRGRGGPVRPWFRGPGMVQGVRLRGGRAEWYRNRWVRSGRVAEALGEAWPGGPVPAGMDFAADTHILAHAGRLRATVEAGPLPYQLTDELDTGGARDFA